MLRSSSLTETALRDRLWHKFEGLKEKIALEQDIQLPPRHQRMNPMNQNSQGLYEN
jgi:hypothetical protein